MHPSHQRQKQMVRMRASSRSWCEYKTRKDSREQQYQVVTRDQISSKTACILEENTAIVQKPSQTSLADMLNCPLSSFVVIVRIVDRLGDGGRRRKVGRGASASSVGQFQLERQLAVLVGGYTVRLVSSI